MTQRTPTDRGVSEIVSVILAFGLVVSVVAMVQLAGTPVWTAGDEADHSASVSSDLTSLDAEIFRASGLDSDGRVAVDTGVSYPERYLVVSPPDRTGTFRADGADSVTLTGVSASGPESVFWNGSTQTYTTNAIVYHPDYAERDEAKLFIESGVSYLEDDGNTVVQRQSLVSGTTVTLVFFEGGLDGHTTAGETVSLAPVSVRSESLPVYNATDPIRISVPTSLPEDAWADLMADEPHAQVASYTPSGDHALVTIQLDAGVQYDFRIARLGVGEALDPDPATYAVAVQGEDSAVPAGGSETLVVRAFDRYGAPVAGARLTAQSTTPLGGTVTPLDGGSAVTDESGRAQFTYTAPDGITNIESDTVTIALDGANGPGSTVTIPLEVRGFENSYNVRNVDDVTPTPSPDPTPDPDPTPAPTPEPDPTPAPEDDSAPVNEDDFVIDDGSVVTAVDFNGDFELLGSAIKSGNRDVPVEVTFVVGDDTHSPAGWENVNDGQKRSFSAAGNAGDGVHIVASADGYVTADSSVDHGQVAVLRNGDPVPEIKGYNGQDDAEEFVEPYISEDGQTMALDDNQAIFLFELGTTNQWSRAYDLQDAVILVTLWEDDGTNNSTDSN
ncbi:hypothetical protein C440_03513 [Haloferax mucosum ATCC BAA-1512]|uniref:Big-1 domain-containing protein n=1 Tax=Haloferax mucosum ATCC BAA-1512 TaxID=662479 RepID=M0IJ71_9EURY|nr:Ig-like domain-containing protein [Haloferax mucosum]ELZ96810.1 hypothetical protein C440_03513 [Haloferax mucosum ATCC BAA-1512]